MGASRGATAGSGSHKICSIQYLRAIAALGVVAFHALESSPHRFVTGAAGVDVFFVISGFIIWTVSAREPRPSLFLRRRLWRIAPAYWIATLLVAALAIMRPHLLWRVEPQPGHLLLSLGFIPHLDPFGRLYPLLIQGWTLNYEAFFYVLFAVLLFLPRRWQLPSLLAAMLGLAALGWTLRPASPVAHTYTDPLLLEFAAGVALAAARDRGWLAGPLKGAGLVVLALAGFALTADRDLESDALRWVYWGAPAVALVAGAICLEQARAVPNLGWLTLLGDASYSIYLFHVPILAVVSRVTATAPIPVQLAASLAAAALGGLVAFRFVERPLGRLARASESWSWPWASKLPTNVEPGAA